LALSLQLSPRTNVDDCKPTYMNASVLRILEFVAVLGCLSSSVYYCICLRGARIFLRQTRADNSVLGTLPPVSILKPLKGADREMCEAFRSHCLQDYPEYEIIFGVSEPDDPAIDFVKQLQRESPKTAIVLVVCPKKLGANVKISNLEQMLASARFDHLLVNDSDIRVEPGYLRQVMTPLADERVGMVTCLYRGVGAPTLGSRLESLGISADFIPGVLVARQLEGALHFALGSTMAFRRADLVRIGGFQSIVDFLADDYELGRRIADLGLQVQLSDVIVETHLPAYDLRGFLAHQLRWARGVRDARAAGYIGLVTTFGLMWGILAVAFAHAAPWSWAVLGVTVFLRLAVAITVGEFVLRDRALWRNLWLLPARDLFAVGVWIASFLGDRVTWRGDRFELKDGRLVHTENSKNSAAQRGTS
jgi:ceramide glucosyltransferase